MTIETLPAAAVSRRVFLASSEPSATPLPTWMESAIETLALLEDEGSLEEIQAGLDDITAGRVVSLEDARRAFIEQTGR